MELEPSDAHGLVSQLRDALARNGVVADVIASFTEAEREKLEKLPEPQPNEDPLKDMVVDIVENKKFLMEYLLVSCHLSHINEILIT